MARFGRRRKKPLEACHIGTGLSGALVEDLIDGEPRNEVPMQLREPAPLELQF